MLVFALIIVNASIPTVKLKTPVAPHHLENSNIVTKTSMLLGLLQKKLLQHSGELMADVIGNNLSTTTAETEIELNFAVVKIKHKIIRKDER